MHLNVCFYAPGKCYYDCGACIDAQRKQSKRNVNEENTRITDFCPDRRSVTEHFYHSVMLITLYHPHISLSYACGADVADAGAGVADAGAGVAIASVAVCLFFVDNVWFGLARICRLKVLYARFHFISFACQCLLLDNNTSDWLPVFSFLSVFLWPVHK